MSSRLLKQVDRNARVAWCATPKYNTLLCTGTCQGTIDEYTFDTKSQLELFDLDLGNNSYDMRPLGHVTCKESFFCLSWGTKGVDEGIFAHGLIAGGMNDGSIYLWNADAVIGNRRDVLVNRLEQHKGQVNGLEFHPKQSNLLASAAADAEVLIWDINDPKKVQSTRPSNQAPPKGAAGVSALAWNKKTFYVIATSNELGETHIWDLRTNVKRAVVHFQQHARMQCKTTALSWNPEGPVQLAVSYSHPVAEIWDLRHSMAPSLKLEGGHTSTIYDIDWCHHDSNLIITSGDDSRTSSWSTVNGRLLAHFESPGSNFEVQWSPHIPGMISSSTMDGKVSIECIHHAGGSQHVAKWLCRPSGCCFGFGGKLAHFHQEFDPTAAKTQKQQPQPNYPAPSFKVYIDQMVSEPQLLELSQRFQQVVKKGDYLNFCTQMINEAPEGEKFTWRIMRILFEEPTRQRELLLKELGFEPNQQPNEESQQQQRVQQPPQTQQQHPSSGLQTIPPVDEIPEDNFFDQVPNQTIERKEEKEKVEDKDDTKQKESEMEKTKEVDEKYDEKKEEAEDDAVVRHALTIADFKTAVNRSIEKKRWDDALAFASFEGQEFFSKIRVAFLQQHSSAFVRSVMVPLLNSDLSQMVARSDVKSWKETLAVLMTYTTDENYRQLVNLLASRLELETSDLHAAIVCYMCASNVDKTVELWSREGELMGNSIVGFHSTIEKISVFAFLTKQQGRPLSKILAQKYGEYATLLASQGCMSSALEYLRLSNPSPDDEVSANLMDRIYNAAQPTQQTTSSKQLFEEKRPASIANPPQNRSTVPPRTVLTQPNQIQQTNQLPSRPYPHQQQLSQPILNQQTLPSHQPLPPQPQSSQPQPQSQSQSQPQQLSRGLSSRPSVPLQNPSPTTNVASPLPSNPRYPTSQATPASSVPFNPYTAATTSPPPTNPLLRSSIASTNPTNPTVPTSSMPSVPTSSMPSVPASSMPSVPSVSPLPTVPTFPSMAQMSANTAINSMTSNVPPPRNSAPFPRTMSRSPASSSMASTGPLVPSNQSSSTTTTNPPVFMPPTSQFPNSTAQSLPSTFPPEQNYPNMLPQMLLPQQRTHLQKLDGDTSATTQSLPFPPPSSSSPSPSSAPLLPFPSPALSATSLPPPRSFSSSLNSASTMPSSTSSSAPVSVDSADLMQTLDSWVDFVNNSNIQPADKKRLEDVRKRLGGLSEKLSKSDLASSALSKLNSLCSALKKSDIDEALKIHMNLVTADWEGNNQWLPGVKMLLTLVKKAKDTKQ